MTLEEQLIQALQDMPEDMQWRTTAARQLMRGRDLFPAMARGNLDVSIARFHAALAEWAIVDEMGKELAEMGKELAEMGERITKRLSKGAESTVRYQLREIGEGGWVYCTKAQYEWAVLVPHMDSRIIPAL